MYGPQEAMLSSSLPHVPLCSCARVGCDHVNGANHITFPIGALFTLAQEVVNFDVPEFPDPGWKEPNSAACDGWEGARAHPGLPVYPHPIMGPSRSMGGSGLDPSLPLATV